MTTSHLSHKQFFIMSILLGLMFAVPAQVSADTYYDAFGNAYTSQEAANAADNANNSAVTGSQTAARTDGFVPLAPIPGLTEGTTGVINSATLADFLNNLYKYLIGIAATLAVIEITWGGILYSTSSVGNKEEGKEKIRWAILGLVLVLSPVLVFSIINPSILNLSLNLPPIKTLSVPATVPSGTGDATAAKAADCSPSLGDGSVSCPTQEAAAAFAASCSNKGGRVYLSNDPSLPYSANCNALQPGGNQNYLEPSQIPSGLWCYKIQVYNADKTTNYKYVCGSDKNSCDSLVLNRTVDGVVLSDCSVY